MAHAGTRLLVFLRDTSKYTRAYIQVMYRYNYAFSFFSARNQRMVRSRADRCTNAEIYWGIMVRYWGLGFQQMWGQQEGGICGAASRTHWRLLVLSAAPLGSASLSQHACLLRSTQTGTNLSPRRTASMLGSQLRFWCYDSPLQMV